MSSKSFRKQDVEGKSVVYSSGRLAGKVKDLAFNLNGTLSLVVEKGDGTEAQVPMSMVTGMADYVVVREETSTSGLSGRGGMVCKFCGREISTKTTWCPSCGRSQG